MLKNDRLLRALNRQPVDRTPVWLMRQAGRYLPEYRATRARAGSFLGMAKNPDIACEVTLQPLQRFPLDAAILFSDILTIPDAMGLELYFVEGEGPKFRHPVRDAAAIHRLGVPDMETELRYVMDAVRVIRRELDGSVPLIGFSGSPWTLACYMIEGGGSKEYARIKAMAFNAPELLHHLLNTVTDAVIAYLAAQRAAGAQALQVFDTWGGVLSPAMYREFSLPYLTRIARELERDTGAERTPLVLFGKGNGAYVADLAASGAEAVGVDWTIALADAAQRAGGRVALQGNLDPATLYGSPEAIRAEVGKTLDSYAQGNGGSREGHVFNLGHGMSPDMNPEHVGVLVEAVQSLSRR
ncbi:uroporphyrinogen decarboxylase [Xanthomonas citri pv. malvacearum]|uniref:Uroporphyrinogen decarboxylase n=1 Tax=Xanthomonas campestris pv. malvacearum TaxID=86040 RepID=A0AA45BV01_XANCM|nr:uroporphyrinogen decarboxylase [Xanthomonas citri]OOW58956.1 uroporphyrinogen decarboxylase [Xanthomonas campestris pv. thespesiae]OOW80119.1 uroporphyrinogen decarboxylase [Xanthomonas campestris pv. leeana]AOL18962.1 uroporphyrinogen decarboxylase [Xanthomonas citri pv. malvacearum]ASN00525.1 uroporphyrinogen decarboxylase [Xanthomonas citri pv. malvacearum]ASN10344.1 uroporphyrinogen decarboxylase [Xanthomonas citri pv. malvacearum]